MLESITDWFQDIEFGAIGWTLVFWAFCLVVLWKLMYDPNVMSWQLKLVTSIVALPIIYAIMYFMTGDR